MFDERSGGSADSERQIAIVAYPHISNLDEFQSLRGVPGLHLRWARTPGELAGAAWVVLPGSKNTSGDLAWMRAQGLDQAVLAHAARGGAVLGLCGGLQILGGRMDDPHGVEGNAQGLGLLPLETRFERDKRLCHTRAQFTALQGAWRALGGVSFDGYEIRHGHTWLTSAEVGATTTVALHNDAGDAIGWQRDNVLGVYAHGLFESPLVMRALLGVAPRTLESIFDGLADFIDARFKPGALAGLVTPGATRWLEENACPTG